MNTIGIQRIRLLSAGMMTAALGFAAPVVAAPPIPLEPPPLIDFAANQACVFPLRLENSGGNFHLKPFFDKNGNIVRAIIAGKGSFVTFTNLDSGATLSLKTYGFSAQQTFNADGTITETDTGHVVLILFPTDVPAGPSTTSYVGRLVWMFDPSTGAGLGIQSFTGKAIDICDALAD